MHDSALYRAALWDWAAVAWLGVGDPWLDTPFSRRRVSFRINFTAGITRMEGNEGRRDRVSMIEIFGWIGLITDFFRFSSEQ